jgi:hypothetical protein
MSSGAEVIAIRDGRRPIPASRIDRAPATIGADEGRLDVRVNNAGMGGNRLRDMFLDPGQQRGDAGNAVGRVASIDPVTALGGNR